MLRNPLFHPYASIIWIRLEGIISACTRRHPLKSAAKIVQIERKTKENHIFLGFSEMQPILERSSKVRISEQNTKKNVFFLYFRA